MQHKAPQFLLPYLTQLQTNTSGELGYQVVYTRITTPDTEPFVPPGQRTQR